MLDLLRFVDVNEGRDVATLGVAAYDGRTITKRDGERKVMQFSSGKFGYFAGGKVEFDGKRYQVSCSLVEIAAATNGAVKHYSPAEVAAMNMRREAIDLEQEVA